MELSSLNRYLQEEDATYESFKKLRQRNPALAWQCFFLVEPLLLKHGDYALCLEYLGDPEAAFDRLRRQWDLMKGREQRGETTPDREADTAASFLPPSPPRTADQRLVDETRQLILILVKTEHRPEAQHIRDEALELVDDSRLKSSVTDADEEPARR